MPCLQVLPVCAEAVQKQLIGFLPEIAQEGEQEVGLTACVRV